MLAGAGQIGMSAVPLLGAGALDRSARVVERLCDLRPERERRPAECCPPPAPPPYSCHLEDRNARDRVELTFSEHLARLPDAAAPRGGCEEPPARAVDADTRRGLGPAADPALRGPRLGDVLPVRPVPPVPPALSPARLDVTA